jgi:peptide deformylase
LILPCSAFSHRLRHYPDAPLKIITIGHPTLYLDAQTIEREEIRNEKFQKFLDNMIQTMKDAGGVGLAAPQVNVSKRVFVIKPSIFKKAQVYINPIVEYIADEGMQTSKEGCLSIPGKTFKVQRYNELNVTYQDRHGHTHAQRERGFRAVVIQHEYDHLNGTLISDIFTESFSLEDDFEFVVPQM